MEIIEDMKKYIMFMQERLNYNVLILPELKAIKPSIFNWGIGYSLRTQ